MFYNCPSLKKVTMCDGVTKLENNAFRDCKSLTDIRLGKYITTIGNSAFAGCERFASFVLPDYVTKLEGYAFYGCKALQLIQIPVSVTEIQGYCFFNTDLKKVYYKGAESDWNEINISQYGNELLLNAKRVSGKLKLAKPVIKTAKVTSAGYPKLTVKEVYGAVSYTWYRATAKNGTYSKIKTVSGLSMTDKTAKKNKTFYYKVVANSGGSIKSTYSEAKKITVK